MRRFRAAFLFACCCSVASAQTSFTGRDKLALTYLFYWYNSTTGYHYGDGPLSQLTLHPPDSYVANYSFTDPVFFQRELSDMAAAGIDVALPVFWSDSGNTSLWSVPGLKSLSQALQSMSGPAPKIGMFHDISSLQLANGGAKPDLTTAAGKSLFYTAIYTFFSNVPRQFWAMIDGRPIVVLYLSAMVSAYDQTTFDYVAQQFQQDFGTTPYIIRHGQWYGVKTDAAYAGWSSWYSAAFMGDVAAVGPGFNNYAVQAAEGGLIAADRNCGDLYNSEWNQVVARGARLVLIETWNELHEGSGISATKEYGRRFIESTAQNIARWKAAAGTATSPGMVWTSLGAHSYVSGLYPALNTGDGGFLTTRIAGRDAMYTNRTASFPAYSIYLGVDDRFLPSTPAPVWVTVEYLDQGSTPIQILYDGSGSPYTATASFTPGNTGLWKRQTFYLPDAVFQKRLTGTSDLLIHDFNNQGVVHYFNRVWITKTEPAGQPPQVASTADTTVTAGTTADVSMTASTASGNPLTLTLASAPGFASLLGSAGAQSLHLAPATADARSCADVSGPNVTSSSAYVMTAVTTDPASSPSTGAAVFSVNVIAPAITLGSASLTFNTLTGLDPAPQTLNLFNSGAPGTTLAWTAAVSTSSGGNWLSINPASGTNDAKPQVAAHATSLRPGTYTGSIVVSAPNAVNSPSTVAVTLNVVQPPVIQAVTDSWNYVAGVAPGAWVTIVGTALAAGAPQTWNLTGTQLPTSIGDVSVTFNGAQAALLYVSATQINALVPASVAPGPVQVVVQSNGVSSAPFAATGAPTLPAVYAPPNADGSTFFVTAALAGTATLIGNSVTDPRVLRPAQPGDTLDLYMIGLGATSDASRFLTNQVFSGAFPVVANVTARIGGEAATVLFAGLTSPGLYLVRVTLPGDLAPGPQALQITAGAARTPSSVVLMVGVP